ncbi:AT-rich interactive domain-containing protein 5B-like [Elysia marginata]|uniref:AT-rich interactive domain-containing protein 5B-like n=1 Tax=Elysia marginata TaxID=1093978 RepID=A0AAV4GZW2_9GAST|nr:AT-rich interactive domain-containing protein 5B-like [Elysia marginata]
MEGVEFQFYGAPCLQHTNYVFYKAFKYKNQKRSKILAQGDFFFLKILQDIPLCIAEIELIWEDKASNQQLSSLRLYFRPEHTPDGRQDDTGKDEMLALGERIVLRLDDLVPLIQEDVKWAYGSDSPCSDSGNKAASKLDGNDSSEGSQLNKGIKDACDESTQNGSLVKEEKCDDKNELSQNGVTSGAANVAVMNYARYCRYRALCRRLEGCESQWLHVAVVVAIGGYSSRRPGCRVMFCRDTFYQAEIDDWDCRMDHMLPVLKSRGKTKKNKISKKDSPQDSDSMEEMFANVVPTISASSRPRRLTESGETNDDKVSTHEQAFLIGLHKFMHDAKMPIGRIPSLGFKQIDLYYFYKQADKLGGYDSITHKRMWKHLYDKLGGNSSNTSAATCTRKHYERLLLPYERHLRKLKNMKNKKHGIHGEEEKSHKQDSLVCKNEADITWQHETSAGSNPEFKLSKEKQRGQFGGRPMSEHSKYPSGDTEVLEIPVVRQRVPGSSNSKSSSSNSIFPGGFPPGFDLQGMNGLTYAQLEQLQQQALQSGDPAAAAAYANMVYQGGYLMPLLPSHLLQSQWGLLAQPPPHSSSSTMSSHMDPNVFQSRDPSVGGPSPAKKVNQRDSKPASSSLLPSKHQPSQAHKNTLSPANSEVKPAHTNTPYIPSPYLLNDHIQTANSRKSYSHSSSSIHHIDRAANNLFGALATKHLISVLHPTPGDHRSQPHLPPAPLHLYLDPTCTNPFSPLPAPISGAPPTAHIVSRKRSYPFDNPGAFPSPDIVLDRIKSSTSLPRVSKGPTAVHSNSNQRYDNPRDILQHTQQSFLASQASRGGGQQHKQTIFPNTSKLQGNKSKNGSKRNQSGASAYSSTVTKKTVPEGHNSLLLQQPSGKMVEQVKPASNSNGYMLHHHSSNGSPVPNLHMDQSTSSIKDGRLTSALFGTQFTALPRSTKPSEPVSAYASDPAVLASPSSSSSAAAAAAAALSVNPHLHPAFLSPFLPPSSAAPDSSPVAPVSPAGSLNSQLQMLASAYGTTPAQLAAYEEILRQNGYGAFMLPPTGAHGVPSSPHSVAVAQPSKGSKKH